LYDGKFITYEDSLPNNQLQLNCLNKCVAMAGESMFESFRYLGDLKKIKGTS
jgi:hypothetical protein